MAKALIMLEMMKEQKLFTQSKIQKASTIQKLVGNLPAGINPELEDIKIVASLKNLSSFIFNLNFLMINFLMN